MKRTLEAQMIKSPYVGEADDSLKEVHEMMLDCNIRHLPIVDDAKKLIGLVSDRDVREALALPQAQQLSAGDIMKRDVYVARRRDSLCDVVRQMQERKIGSTVVTNESGEVVGIFTTTDALEILADLLTDRDDEDKHMLLTDDYFDVWGQATLI